MAWEKTKTTKRQASSSPDDLSLRFYKSDAAASPPNALRVEVRVETDGDPQPEVIDFPLAASMLTAQQKLQLRALLVQLRDEAYRRAGYAEAAP